MASAKFLEEALSTDVDESAVSAIVGSLENQLVTSSTTAPASAAQNHVNSAISNGGTVGPPKHSTVANGDSISDAKTADAAPVKIVYSQAMAGTGTLLPNARVALPPNGTLPQTAPGKQPTLVIKTCGASAPGLVTVPMNVTTSVPPANNVVNVRPGVPAQQQKGQPARVVLSAPQIVGARPGAPQLTLQTFHGLQPGQQGHLLLKTENGQYQLLRVGPPPATANLTATSTPGGQPVTLRMQTVAAAPASSATTSPAVAGGTTTVSSQGQTVQTVTTVQRPANDNTKEKCRKFLANLLELSSKEPKSVERSVRTLIQELIDMKVEPEDFCDKLERLLNASPQPCLIGFLKKSLPLLRHSLVTKELTIDGIRPPPANVVFSIASGTPTIQTQVRPGIASNQVRIVAPGTAVVRPGHVLQQRLVTPLRGATQQTPRMMTTIRQPNSAGNVIVSSSQPPALHPVYPSNQVRAGSNIRQPLQVNDNHIIVKRTLSDILLQNKSPMTSMKLQGSKPAVPSIVSRPTSKEKEKKSFSAAYTGDDDINDVAAMGGVNLAEETQKILGSTEFVGTQIRSCKEEIMCSMGPLQQKIRQIVMKHGLEEPSADVAACISHAAQERLKNLIEKLAIITEHRLEMVKKDLRYEVTNDVKGQLKFLEDVDRAERKRHEELEREMLLRAAKSRSKTEDPEQAKLKAKAREMQRVEMEELRQREANATALQAIGPRKKPRLDGDAQSSLSQANAGGFNSGLRGQMPLRQRMKKVTLRDLQFLFETEKDLCKSKLLYKSYLK
ncbi:transcription initiation factor TFIID subunit 4 isoform X2 [Tribolium madens]|uniref:transcription initiation factor TFIID subunit 4 isoform X2 n=1 Tax=Tribolium madens TaxID=41895 RepID=UPI001CF736B5|nr:transcription initiation factor TFIID subunit 4 isoform X2 [Tribolium madens]